MKTMRPYLEDLSVLTWAASLEQQAASLSNSSDVFSGFRNPMECQVVTTLAGLELKTLPGFHPSSDCNKLILCVHYSYFFFYFLLRSEIPMCFPKFEIIVKLHSFVFINKKLFFYWHLLFKAPRYPVFPGPASSTQYFANQRHTHRYMYTRFRLLLSIRHIYSTSYQSL